MMAGSAVDVTTLVLVGRTGNGKSATGNTILGRKAFISRASSSGANRTCELQQAVLQDGPIINVIVTPGLFDTSPQSGFVGGEIEKCMDLAKDGVHAFLLVLSVRTRFSEEEEAAIQSLRALFGQEIVKYTIVVFTGGDDLEEDDETLDEYLGRECPEPLKNILNLCENRRVLFNNKTKDEAKRSEQVQQLLSLVNMVRAQNNGKPYTNEKFAEMKKRAMTLQGQQEVGSMERYYSKEERRKLQEQMQKSYDDQLKSITEMTEAKEREKATRLERELAEQNDARMRAERQALFDQAKREAEINNLRERLELATREAETLERQPPRGRRRGGLDQANREAEIHNPRESLEPSFRDDEIIERQSPRGRKRGLYCGML